MSNDPRTLPLPGFEPGSDPHCGSSSVTEAGVVPAPAQPRHDRVAASLPEALRLGTSSWGFPGWRGIVWAGSHPREQLAREGLGAYAHHPLLRAVGLDSTYYRPLGARQAEAYRSAVGPQFRFLAKAHEHCTLARFPRHPRYAAQAGEVNPRFLDASYAGDAVVAPLAEGLGTRLGAVLFQFPPQPTAALGGVPRIVERLHRFLDALPAGPLYAVEIRNADWLGPDYARALRAAGAVHCLGVHPRMPPPEAQARIAAPAMERALVVRWNLGHGLAYEAARERYAPFDRLAAEDPPTRDALAGLIARHLVEWPERPTLAIVNNKAEGCAPLSVFELAGRTAELVEELIEGRGGARAEDSRAQ